MSNQPRQDREREIKITDGDLDKLNQILVEKRDRLYEQGRNIEAVEVEGVRLGIMGQQAQQIGKERSREGLGDE